MRAPKLRLTWILLISICAVMPPAAHSDWIPLDTVASLLELPSAERRLQVAMIHAEYRAEFQRIRPGDDPVQHIPWERSDDRLSHDPARFQELLHVEAELIETLVGTSLIGADSAHALRMAGALERLRSDTPAKDLLAGGSPPEIEQIVKRCVAHHSERLGARYRNVATQNAELLVRLETQLHAARVAWHRETAEHGRFVIDPTDSTHPMRRVIVPAWNAVLADAYVTADRYRELLAREARRALRSADLAERALAAQILRFLAGLGSDILLDGIAMHALARDAIEGAEAAAAYIDAVAAAIPQGLTSSQLIPATPQSRRGATPSIALSVSMIRNERVRDLSHLLDGVDRPHLPPAHSIRSFVWPRIGPATIFIAPQIGTAGPVTPEALGLPIDRIAPLVEIWMAQRGAVRKRADDEAPDHYLGHIQAPVHGSFSTPEDVTRCFQWLQEARARVASIDQEFVASVAQEAGRDRAELITRALQAELTIDNCRRTGLMEHRPEELQLDLIAFLLDQAVFLESMVDELELLAGPWTSFVAAEVAYWHATQFASGMRYVRNPPEPDWDRVPDRAAAEEEFRRGVTELTRRKRSERDKVPVRHDEMIAARRTLIESQRQFFMTLVASGAISEAEYDRVSFPEVHARFASLLAGARDEMRRAGIEDDLLATLLVEPATAALQCELTRRRAIALDGLTRTSHFDRVFADLATVTRLLGERR